MDNQEVIVADNDSKAQFYLGKDHSMRRTALARHLDSWKLDAARHSIDDLSAYLQQAVDARVAHVKEWLHQNTARFPPDNSDIRALNRDFEQQAEVLQANVQLCLAECTLCRLRCMLPKSHTSSDHTCNTSHQCEDLCDYLDEHEDSRTCGFP